ncbi:hypothetical protein SUGI_0536750 [Cryptomeria japonica]|nr:hypothetical protein SUGI_0536750 [Cryptomeria japonica]
MTCVVIMADLLMLDGKMLSLGHNFPPLISLCYREGPLVVIVGEWYCPFIFINELGTKLEDPKLMECPFYKMDLENFWEEIYSTRGMTGKDIDVDKILKVEEALLFGEDVPEEIRYNDGSVLFRGAGKQSREASGMKLSWPFPNDNNRGPSL